MKKLITMISMMLATVAFAATAFAAGSFSGKVTKIDGTRVTVTADQPIPAWAKKGTNVSAMGGGPKVLEVNGNDIVLRFGKAKLEQIKQGATMNISESAGDELQGC